MVYKKHKRMLRDIGDLYALAGHSPTQLAASIGVKEWVAENFRFQGIPIKYWDSLMDVYDITPAELYVISKRCRENKPRSTKSK